MVAEDARLPNVQMRGLQARAFPGFRVQGLWLGFRVWGLGFRVSQKNTVVLNPKP